MSNSDKPHGFNPYGAISPPHPYDADPTGATAFFNGDVVDAGNNGYCVPGAAGATEMLGAAGHYLAAATSSTIMVYDDPDQQFQAQTVSGTAPTRTIIGNQCNHIAGAGSTITLLSGHELDISTTDATTGFGWVLLHFLNRVDNDTTTANAEMICKPYEVLQSVAANTGI